jgi:hypothetical protein
MKNYLSFIRKIETVVYPSGFRQMEDIETMGELKSYCEGKPYCFTWDNGYCLWTKTEIVDIASNGSIGITTMFKLMTALKTFFGKRKFTCDARGKTSYPIIKRLETRGVIQILKSESWEWNSETFYDLELRFTGK